MPVFEFKGLTQEGKETRGLRDADSPRALRMLLRKEGIFLTDVSSKEKNTQSPSAAAGMLQREVKLGKIFKSKLSIDQLATLTRQLATLLAADVALVEALSALVDQAHEENIKRILSDVKQRVNEGASLANGLEAHKKDFGELYINMVHAGEHSGDLDAVLLRLAEFSEGQARLKQKIIATLTYPVIMAVMGILILSVLMTYVVPKVAKLFEDMHSALPLTTRILMSISNTFQNYWFIIFPTAALLVFAALKWTKSKSGQPIWHRWQLKLPLVGNLVRMVTVARFARTLSTLLKSGVPVLNALEIVQNVIPNSVISNVIKDVRESVREGESISAPLKRSGHFPPLVFHMIAVGERSGKLEEMLLSIAESYEQQSDIRIGSLTSILEPIIILAMGGVVFFVAVAVLQAMYALNTLVR
ncbi:MAG: type II secretion system inner membrane protein GspF [Cystobacterineae bacterium]|nr:type II secretion system inner membrane protein GspF [Cystobacterineae bacterium]